MGDQQEKKPASKRLGSLHSGLGRADGRLGSYRGSDGAGPSNQAAAPALGGPAGPRKMRFLPTNFARAKKEESVSTDITSVSVGKSEGAFDDLMKAAKNEASWQRRRGRGGGAGAGGRGPSTVTTFGGGAGDLQGRRPVARGVGSWGGAKGRATGAASSGAQGAAKSSGEEGEEGVKDEDMSEQQGQGSDGEEEGGSAHPLDYDSYYPILLPMHSRDEERISLAAPPAVPPDIMTMPEHAHDQQQELEVLHDIESNDSRLMLFQLPSALPIPVSAAGGGGSGGGPVVNGRPAALTELPTTRIGKLLVFESGAIKLQIGEVLLDVTPGVPCGFRQDVAVVNPQARHCVMLAKVEQRVVCSPDLATLLSDEPLPQWQQAPGHGAAEKARAGEDGGGAAPMDVDASVAGGQRAEQQQQQAQQAPASEGQAKVKEEPEVNSPRAKGVPRSRRQTVVVDDEG